MTPRTLIILFIVNGIVCCIAVVALIIVIAHTASETPSTPHRAPLPAWCEPTPLPGTEAR